MIADGESAAIRWATRNRYHDTDWGKWHLIKAGGVVTACGQVVRLFEADGSPQEGPVERVTCKHCLRLLSRAYGGGLIEGKRNVTPNKTQLVALLQRVDAVEANWALETLAGAGEELTLEPDSYTQIAV